MKKRKILAVLLSLVLIVSTFAGCAPYTAYSSNDEIWSEYKNTYTPPSEASVTFNGMTYTGTYSGSTNKYSDYRYEFYSYEGDGVSFEVDANGRLCTLSLDHQENEVCAFDEVRWRKVADELADDYISLDTYQVRYVVNEDPHLHEYRYERDIGSDRSMCDIRIMTNCSGEICFFNHAIDFENVKSVDADEDKVQRAVDKYMKKQKRFGDKYTRWEIGATALTKTSSNQCAVLCRVLPYYIGVCGYEHCADVIDIIVIVDHEKYDPSKP